MLMPGEQLRDAQQPEGVEDGEHDGLPVGEEHDAFDAHGLGEGVAARELVLERVVEPELCDGGGGAGGRGGRRV